MKNKHKNVKLDTFLNQKVKVKFTDNSWSEGVLIWRDTPDLFKNMRYSGYYLVMDNYNLHFTKSDVKHIERIY